MAYSQTRIGRARIRAQADWGISNAVAAGSFSAGDTLECEVFVPELVEEALSTEAFRGGFHAHRVTAGSRAGTTISVTMPLHGLSSTAPAAEPTATPDALILATALGYGAATTGHYDATNLAGGDANDIDWTDASGVEIGAAMLLPLSSGHSIGWVQDITEDTPDVVGLISPLSAAPASSGQVYGSYVCALSTAQSLPLTMLWVGSRGEQVRLYDGTVTEATITLTRGQQPQLSATLQFAGWIIDAASGSAPGQYAFSLPQLPAALGRNGARVVVDGTASAFQSFEISIANEVAEVGDFAAQEGIGAYATTNRSVTATLTRHEVDLSDMQSPGDSLGTVQVDLAIAPGRALSVLIPAAQVQERESISDMDGLLGSTLTLAPGVYTGDGIDNLPGNSPFRIAFL